MILSNVEPFQCAQHTVRLCTATYRSNCDHWPQIRQAAPKPVMDFDMALLQLPRPCGPEPLARIMLVPDVKVADLRAFRRQDPANLASLDLPGLPAPYRHGESLHLLAPIRLVRRVSNALVEFVIARDGIVGWGWRLSHDYEVFGGNNS